MASRLTRWAVASGLGLVAVFAATLPPGPGIIFGGLGYSEGPGPTGAAGLYAANKEALARANQQLYAALRRQGLRRSVPSGPAPVVVRFDHADVVRDPIMTAAAESLWLALPRAADAPRIVLFETHSPRMAAAFTENAADLCIAPFDSANGPRQRTLRRSAGVCALAYQFGPPGAPMRAWLDTVVTVSFGGIALPKAGQGVVTRLDSWGSLGWRRYYAEAGWSLTREQEACAGGRLDRCARSLGFDPAGPHSLTPGAMYRTRRGTAALPAALLADLGPERFRQLWRSDDPVPATYERLTGRSFDRWAMTYVQDAVGRIEKDNGLTALGWVGWALWLGIVLGWFAVRVERRSAT